MTGKRRRRSRPTKRKNERARLAISAETSTSRFHERKREGASFPTAPPRSELPSDYVETLGEIKRRVTKARLRVVVSANSAMVLLYWDIGRMILERQERAGWGAKVIDRLAADLREAFPDMRGFSPRNLKYMRAFAAAWPDAEIVQRVVARLPWRQNIALLERVDGERARLWCAEQAIRNGWSQPILCMQIDHRTHERHGKAVNGDILHFLTDENRSSRAPV